MDVREKQSSVKRLIDADALISYMDECSKESRFRVYYGYAKSFINAAPTVDSVEVVRCKDCKFRSSWMMNRNLRYICPESGMFPNSENDFCSYGERKEGAE